MTDTNASDIHWPDYYDVTAERPSWTTTKIAAEAFGEHPAEGPRYAVDLGCGAEGDVVALGFGSDHTSWAYLRFEEASATDGSLTTEETYLLARFPPMRAGRDQYPERMDVFESELDPRSLLETCCGTPRLDVAPDGSVWLPSDLGLARFDGVTWDWYLEGRPIEDVDITTDGTVWVRANDLDKGPGVAYWEQEGTTSTYVITPEAMAAAE